MTNEKKEFVEEATETKAKNKPKNSKGKNAGKQSGSPTSEKKEEKPKKVFKQDTPILCKSVRQNNLSYRSHTGIEYRWMGFGDLREVPYGDIVSLKAKRSAYLYEPWFLIMDEDLMAKPEFQKEFGRIKELYEEFDNPRDFFERPLGEIKEALKDMPRGLRDLIVYNAGQYINDGTLDRIGVINALDEAFGTNLRMLI